MARSHSFGIVLNIPKATYQKAKRRVAASSRYWKKHGSHSRGGSSLPADKAANDPATNRDRAVVEVYELKNRKVARPITGYYKVAKANQPPKITNFLGHRICTVQHRTGKTGVTAKCIDGRTYVGRSNGDGMWINLRPKKGR